MSRNVDDDDGMASGDEGSTPPLVDHLPAVGDGVGLGAGGDGARPDLVVPVPAAPAATVPGFASLPSVQPPGPQNLPLQRAHAGQVHQEQLRLLQQALVAVQGVPPGFLAGSALPGSDAPQLPLFQRGMGLPGGHVGPFHKGALHQALPTPDPPLVPGQALPAA